MIIDRWGGGGIVSYIKSTLRVIWDVTPLSLTIQAFPPAQYLQVVQQMPRGGSSYYLHYHCANSNHSKQNSSETRQAAKMWVEGLGMPG